MFAEVLARPSNRLREAAPDAALPRGAGHSLEFAPAKGAAAAATPASALVSVTNLHKAYRLGQTLVPAVRGVSLDVAPGELLAICGPSGSGKTTLLNMIGLIDRPDEGRVLLNGEDVGGFSHDRMAALRNRRIGFIFQSFNLMPVLTAFENVLLPLQIRGRVSSAEREKARALLCEVGLADHLNARPDRMSGGQRQRVAIARALVTDPQLVIADEPTANLDSDTSARVMALIGQLNRARGVTFVFSTHDSRVTDHMHRCVWLKDGRVVNLGADPR
jgi:putative ABC transport system ATP-binding protein